MKPANIKLIGSHKEIFIFMRSLPREKKICFKLEHNSCDIFSLLQSRPESAFKFLFSMFIINAKVMTFILLDFELPFLQLFPCVFWIVFQTEWYPQMREPVVMNYPKL